MRLALYQSRLRDAVQSIPLAATACSAPPCTELENVGKQRSRGFELTGDYSPLDTLHFQGEVDIVKIDYLDKPALKPHRGTAAPGRAWQVLSSQRAQRNE